MASFNCSRIIASKIMRNLLTAILILLYTQRSSANQNPFRDPSICGKPQCETPFRKFNFHDNLYKYEYNVDLNTEFSGTGNNASSLFLKATVIIYFPKPCDGILQITDVKLWDHEYISKDDEFSNNANSRNENFDEDDYYGEFTDSRGYTEHNDNFINMHPKSIELAKDLKQHLLRFSFNDGLISEICPNFQESVWALNLKKGILSIFQNTMLRFDVDFNTTEVDTSGECNVQYTLKDVNNVFIKIRKTKNMQTCQKRYSTNSILQSTPYSFRDDKALWPIIDSISYCDMVINNNVYDEIICHEQHQLIVFSNNNTGAITRVKSRLILQGEENYNQADFLNEHDNIVERRLTLLFDHTPSTKPTRTEIKLARDLLKKMCVSGFPHIKREFLSVFTNFLHTIKQLDYEALTQLLGRSTSICEKGKNHVIDALPYIGSPASYQLMRDQLLTNSVPKKVALNWLKTLSFIRRPDEDTVETFYTILEFSRVKDEPEYTLCTAAVIRSFCLYHSNCKQNMRVKLITNSLETEFVKIFNSFHGEKRLHERLIVIMKGLGNIGLLSEQFIAQLHKVILDENVLLNLRLESVYIFRRTDCALHRPLFLNIFTNFNIHSEVRIAAYLQFMICPDYFSIKKIKNTLKFEEINQVGSFVWSHLKNLAKSSSPLYIAVQTLLLDDDISNKYELDIRKFSRNYQQTLFFDEFNFGSTVDMNVIFGTESYLPRMLTFNFTSNLFGHSVNFLELTTRAEGFDELISSMIIPEKWFNEGSILKKNGLKHVLDIFGKWSESLKKNSSGTRSNNSIDNNLSLFNQSSKKETLLKKSSLGDDFCKTKCLLKRSILIKDVNNYRKDLQKLIKNIGYTLKYDYNNPKAYFGVRIFGNDLHYYALNDIHDFAKLVNEFNILEKISEIFSGHEITYTKSNIFLEASYIAPLMIGLPLSIDLFGASSIDLRTSGYINNMNPNASEWNFGIKGKLKPSILVNFVGTMKSDMFYAQAGIKVKSTFYSNTEVEADLIVNGKNLVSFSFNLPQNTSEVLSVQSELIKITKSEDEPQTGVHSRISNTTCTWSLLETTFGLKMCIDYSVPNLNNSKQTIYPGHILSGPLNFSIVLSKSDPTTKKWTFEFTSNKQENNSKWAFIFHTPGSYHERSISANINMCPESFNSSLLFTHGLNKASIICQYLGGAIYKRFDFLLQMNNVSSLHLNMELKGLQERNIWIYKPKMLLAINGNNITGAVGTIRVYEKNGITQNDIDFSFETRKLQMLLRGVMMQSEITKSANITINYRFQTSKIESIYLEGRLLNSGDKSKMEYNGNIKLRSSAHPKLNFASNSTWRSLKGHTEGILTFNNAQGFKDPNSTSIWHIILSRSYSEENIWEGSRSYASFKVKIPRSKVNFKLFVKHEERYKNGSEHNILAEIHLSPKKEALFLFSVLIPQRDLLTFDAFFNITASKFNSSFGRLKFIETVPKSYLIHFNGAWFTEDYIVIKVNYKNHNRLQALKMLIETDSFEATTINAAYRRTQTFTYSNLKFKYGNDLYDFALQLNSRPDNVKPAICEIHINLKEKKYWLNSSLLMSQPKLWEVELHMDRLRDIRIKSSVLNLDEHREISFELNWDINRDPSQRILLFLEYKTPSINERNGQILVTYPGRTITCLCNTQTRWPEYYGHFYTSWDINEAINVKYSLGLRSGQNKSNWLHAEVRTPFNGWNVNTFDASLYNFYSLLLANTSIMWGGNEHIELVYKYDVKIQEALKNIDIGFDLNSSLIELPSISLKILHLYDGSKIETDLSLHYSSANDTKTYCWNSKWELRKGLHYQNISGTIFVISPHKEFWKGGLVTKWSLHNKRNLIGAASITYNLREISLTMNGYVNKFNDNMITINITTPLNEYRNIKGRFGVIEKKRNVVAEIRTPSSALGIEVLLDIKSLANFDVKFSVATPIENVKHAALYAKLKRDAVDMRGIWNNITIGFTGVSYMNDLTDFEYSCKVYTPLKDFEENGFVVKFLKADSFALYLHSRLSRYECGIQINGKPKSVILKELDTKIVDLETRFDENFKPPKIDQKDYSNIENFEYEEFFSYNIDFLIDLLFWPTVEGILDIEEILDYYFIDGNIKLPQGFVDIQNNLYFPDYLHIINVLNLVTPFESIKKMKLITEHQIDIDFRQFHEKLYCSINNAENFTNEAGIEVNYNQITDLVKAPEYYLNIIFELPLKKNLNVTGKLHLEENVFNGNLITTTGKTCFLLTAAIESDQNFLEASLDYSLEENMALQYKGTTYFKQDLSKEDKTFDIKIEIINQTDMIKFQIESMWQCENDNEKITSNGKFIATLLPLKLFEYTFVLRNGENQEINFDIVFSNQNRNNVTFGMRAIKKNEIINAELWTPMQNFKNISLHGTVTASSPNLYQIEGVFYRDMVTYEINGLVHMNGRLPIKTRLQTLSLHNNQEGLVELNILNEKEKTNELGFQFNAIENGKRCKISGNYSYHNETGLNLSVYIESTETSIERIYIKTNIQYPENDCVAAKLFLETPWHDMGLGKVNLWADIKTRLDYGKLNGGYQFDSHRGFGNYEWTWKPTEDMRLLIQSSIEQPSANTSHLHSEIKYINPNKTFNDLRVGAKINFNAIWFFEINGSLNYESINNIGFGLLTHWPSADENMHDFSGQYEGNIFNQDGKALDVSIEGKYFAKHTDRSCITRLSYRNLTDLHSLVSVECTIAGNTNIVRADFQMLRKEKTLREFLATLITPRFENEATVYVMGSYNRIKDSYHYFNLSVNYPYTRTVADMDITIKSIENLNGKLNFTTPFQKAPWLNTLFNISTNEGYCQRFCRVDWPTDFTSMKLRHLRSQHDLSNVFEGDVSLVVPLNTRHLADIKYKLIQKQKSENGILKVFYNEKIFINGTYKRSEQNLTVFKEITEIFLENNIKPMGIYFENSTGWCKENCYLNIKHLEVFDFGNPKKYNITWELHEVISGNEKETKVLVIHPNRTIILTTTSEISSKYKINRRSKLELSKTAWIGYNLVISNKNDNRWREVLAELSYPKRNLVVNGSYLTTINSLNSNASFAWFGADNTRSGNKVVHTQFMWKNEPLRPDDRDNQTITFNIGHYLLEKDLTMTVHFYRGIKELLKLKLLVIYSTDLEHLIEMSTSLANLNFGAGCTKYIIQFRAYHNASELDVKFNASTTQRPYFFEIKSNSLYKREYFPEKIGQLLVLFDLKNKEIEYWRKSPYTTVRVWFQPYLNYPTYGLNATLLNTPDDNTSGFIYVNILDKYTKMYFNLTEDGSQNLHMFGNIPNSRHVYISIWRNYEDISIVDVTSYIKLNHSRQVSGCLHWRPQIKKELKNKIYIIKEAVINSVTESIDFWTKGLYIESLSAASVVWETTKEYNKDFIEEFSTLSVLGEDLEDLRIYLNKSYEANDFYIRSLVNFSLIVLDEISFREHMDSFPAIFSEIRQILGESGKALRKSITQLIDKLKNIYDNYIQAINTFFHGQPLKYLTDFMEKGFERYEKFVKEVHISFINHVEAIWSKLSNIISTYVRGFLTRLEPHIFKAISYLEKIAWDFSKEIFNYINERTNELAESTYFNQVSSFTQDLENLYKDIKAHGAIVNIKKYATIAWKLLKEKYHKLIPFGSELNEVILEICDEMKELEKVKQVQVVINKFRKISSEVELFAEEIKLKAHLHHLYILLRNKLRTYSSNALELANMYREAKTKLVFDPENGVLDFEQKLPISWHAFNETPKFKEIPEYKFISQMRNMLTTNMSILGHIYDLRSYMEAKTWLQPYYSRAYLIDSMFYITHDKRFVDLKKNVHQFTNCTYILSHDFWNNTFTLTIDLTTISQNSYENPLAKINLITRGHSFEIDPKTDTMTFDGISNPMLPIIVEDLIVYRDSDILKIKCEAGFKVECNMKFSLCWLELSGRYFGQTAGLLGTMNNEPFDDFITPSNIIEKSDDFFSEAWIINCCNNTMEQTNGSITEFAEICNQLFSPLNHCSIVMDVEPFLNICMELGYMNRKNPKNPYLKGPCTAALAYIEICQYAKIPMRVPQQCVMCEINNGVYVPESTFMEYNINNESHSSDIVFLVEANECNTFSLENSIVSALEEQLYSQKFINSRYAVIAYGSQLPPFDYPRTISKDNVVFINSTNILRQYLKHSTAFSKSYDGSTSKSDMMHAISIASRLNFRTGVSKTFIIISCSRCDIKQMRFDYSSILQYMSDEGVSLHIITNAEFNVEKPRKIRNFYGFDKQFVYSNRSPEGSSELRNTLHVSNNSFGICAQLALDSEGSVFSVKQKGPIKRLATIFAKRVVQSAISKGNQTCECTGHNSGSAYMICTMKKSSNKKPTNEQNDYDFSDWDWQFEDYTVN